MSTEAIRAYERLLAADRRYTYSDATRQFNAYQRALNQAIARITNPVWLAPTPPDPDMEMDVGL